MLDRNLKEAKGDIMEATILVVDDNRIMCDALRRVFALGGFQTIATDSGLSAISILKERPVNLIMMDLVMPELNGIETAMAIRKSGDANADVPIIIVTSDLDTSNKQDCLDAGVNACITKPINYEDLFNLARHLISTNN